MKYLYDSFEDYLKNSPLAKEKSDRIKTLRAVFALARSEEKFSLEQICNVLSVDENFVVETVYRMAITPSFGKETETKKKAKGKTPAKAKSAKKNELVLVSNGDDWEALYLNGNKVSAGHKISRSLISEYSQKYGTKMVTKYVSETYNDGYAQDLGDFHDKLSDVILE